MDERGLVLNPEGKVRAGTWDDLRGISSSADIAIPQDPLERVLGQTEAIELAKVAAKQRRHLLLVGPPGTGKSMIARALSMHLPKPKNEVRCVHNPENPERPFVEIVGEDDVLAEDSSKSGAAGILMEPEDVPINIAERLGYRCKNCGAYSLASELNCPQCGRSKIMAGSSGSMPFGDILGNMIGSLQINRESEKVTATHTLPNGQTETVMFECAGDKIRRLDEKALKKRRELEKNSNKKTIVKLNREPFVLATGASETELLGDVRHDPYGGHAGLGTPPYERVVAGSIHEAHEGVLFVDEISHLGNLQRFILTAMQDKRFPIMGRNPQSAGASVKADNVPCDFILVAACNIQDLENILSPLRSRIIGNGYEVLVDVAMPDTPENRAKYAQFVAQEIQMDGRIPHATLPAIEAIIAEGRSRAKADKLSNALTLRLREMGGLIRAAGDIAVTEGAELITDEHVRKALKRARPAEEQIKERYGSYSGGLHKDMSESQKEKSPYYYMNEQSGDNMYS